MTLQENHYDIIIIGAGAAGLTAALYTSRRSLKTLILSKDLGGQASRTPEIENYPGLPTSHGFEMMQIFAKQAEHFGAKIQYYGVEKLEQNQDKTFTIHASGGGAYIAKAVILAFGLTPRDMNVSGENEFKGKGVSYCATCDGPFFKNKTVAVMGGGPNGLEATEYLRKICKKVYIIHKTKVLAGDKNIKTALEQSDNVEILLEKNIIKVQGDTKVTSVILADTQNQEQQILELDGVFVELGYLVQSDWVKDFVELDERKQIVTGAYGETKTPGLFAAGDVTSGSQKQVIISAGDGAKAALAAYRYIQTFDGKGAAVTPDWGIKK